jgi:uridylate kinase
MSHFSEKIVISLGGSLVVPTGGIDIEFLKQFNTFLRSQLAQFPNRQFFIVVGGGATARHYRDAGRNVLGHELSPDDLDWLGIHATKLNAHLIRTIFRDVANPRIVKHYDIIRKVEEQVVVASGWKPGWSTDFCATMICEDYGAKTILNLSNIEKVHTADPRTDPHAEPIDTISWTEFRKIVGDEWIPGMNVPFDPVASKKAQELGLKVVTMKGTNLDNVKNYFDGEEFVGTVIS